MYRAPKQSNPLVLKKNSGAYVYFCVTSPSSKPERFIVLDSLRGVAALAVVIWHIMMSLLDVPASSTYQAGANFARLWQISPFYFLMAGREAVIIFFILSGFVLSLPWLKGSEAPYNSYLIKRVCRIYIPYIATVALALLTYSLFASGQIPELSQWFNTSWSRDPTPTDIIQHTLLIGSFANEQYAVVLWSLVHEMRISIIFPFLMIAVLRWRWQAVLLSFLTLSALGTVLDELTAKSTDYPATFHYLVFFIIGALLAKYLQTIVSVWRRLPRAAVLAVLLVAFTLYSYARILGHFIGESNWDRDIEDLLVGLSASLLIAWLLSSRSAQRVMETGPLVFLGRISYSLYLLHPIVLLSLVHTLSGRVNIYVLLAAVVPISIALAALSYRWVEQPAVSLGKRLTAGRVARESRVS